MIVQPVENRLVRADGTPYPRNLRWTGERWVMMCRAHGYECDAKRMERAQSKRERKNAKRLAKVTKARALIGPGSYAERPR